MPIFKKEDSCLLTNFRPISILPTISKIFERVIYNQLYEHFNTNNLLVEEQYRFRTNHSTEYVFIKLVDHLSNEMDTSNIPCALYIDLSKAFDTLSFDIILQKLKYYGIVGNELLLLTSYLRNRKQDVIFNNHESRVTDITNGVPQGSIVSPLLFSRSIVVNNFKKCQW